tara:strand:+ start:395 stop:601 length:207 start_codon:yes stop_codon:yes gene_type:complete
MFWVILIIGLCSVLLFLEWEAHQQSPVVHNRTDIQSLLEIWDNTFGVEDELPCNTPTPEEVNWGKDGF